MMFQAAAQTGRDDDCAHDVVRRGGVEDRIARDQMAKDWLAKGWLAKEWLAKE
jgi:hypothetical protein